MKNLTLLTILGAGAAMAGSLQPRTQQENFGRLELHWTANEKDRATAAKAWETLTAYHKGLPKTGRKLHVVYITFKDRPALPDYKERYDRIMKNIQAFYADQMQANGFPALTFDLELDENNKLVVHDVYVDKLMKEISITSSGTLAREATKKALAAKGIDIDKEHVLLVCQLPDGVGPYYGGGTSHYGTAYTCDQEGLDPLNFHRTDDMPEARYPMSRGKNTTVYVGGTAHELGHAFGLPHTGFAWGYSDCGNNLMGDGNHTYGNNLRGEGKGSFFAPSDALQLASMPLFCGVETTLTPDADFGEYCGTYVQDEPLELKTAPVKEGVRVTGKVKLDRKPYGVVVHLDPPEADEWVEYDGKRFKKPRGWGDYDTSAASCAVSANGEFEVTICRPGYENQKKIELRVTTLYTDGSRSIVYRPLLMTEEGAVEIKE